MKAMWSGSISFGLVNIPVKLFSGSQSKSLDLDMLRKSDMCSIKYLRVCKNDNKIFEVCQPQQAKKVLDENMRGIPT